MSCDLVQSLLIQLEYLCISQLITTNNSVMSQGHIDQLRSMYKAKQDEKLYLREKFLKRLKLSNDLLLDQIHQSSNNRHSSSGSDNNRNSYNGSGGMSEEYIKYHVERWESAFDDRQLFEPNMRSVSQCLVLLCFDRSNMLSIMAQLRNVLEQYSVMLDEAYIGQWVKKRKKQFSGKEIPPLNYERWDSSIDCFLLRLMRQCFDYFVLLNGRGNTNGETGGGGDSSLRGTTEVLDSCFARITLDTPYAIRNQASLLLGSLSQLVLDSILSYYIKRFDDFNPKKDVEAREIAVYAQVLQVLVYSIGRSPQKLLRLIDVLTTKMPLVSKGTSVLYPELCSGFNKMLSDILCFRVNDDNNSETGVDRSNRDSIDDHNLRVQSALATKQKLQEYEQASAEDRNKLFAQFIRLFEVLQKIIKSQSKHRLICTGTMFSIVSVLSDDLYLKSGSDMLDVCLKNIAMCMKEKKERTQAFFYFVQYLQQSPLKNLRKEVVKIANSVNSAIAILFNKKTILVEEEHATIESFFVEYARTNLSASCKLIEDELRSNPPIEKRIVVLNALSKIVQFTPLGELDPYDATIGVLLADCLKDETLSKNNRVVLPVISCYPRIRPPSEELRRDVRHFLGGCLLSYDVNTSTIASRALKSEIQIGAKASFVNVLENYVRALLEVNDIFVEDACRLLTDLCTCLEIFIGCCSTNPDQKLGGDEFGTVKHKLEGLCLIWLVHPNATVRSKAIQIFSTLIRDDFRASVNETSATYVFEDLLKLDKCETPQETKMTIVGHPSKEFTIEPNEIWSSLSSFFKHSDNPSLVFAWNESFKLWNAPIIKGNVSSLRNMEMLRLMNLAKFLCKSIQSGKPEHTKILVRDLIQLLASKYKSLHEKFHFAIMEILSCVPESSLHIVFGQIKAVGVIRNIIKEKKRERIESSDLLFESNIFDLLEGYISRSESISLNYLFQSEDQTVLSYYEQLILNWTSGELQVNDIPGSAMNSEKWKQAVNIIQLYFNNLYKLCMAAIRHHGGTLVEHSTSNSPLMLKSGVANLMRLIFDFVSLGNPLASTDTVAVRALTSILQFSEVQSTELLTEILEYFHTVISSKKVDKAVITIGMATLLEQNPQLLKSYMNNTRPESLVKTIRSIEFQNARAKRCNSLRAPVTTSPTFTVFARRDTIMSNESINVEKEMEDNTLRLEAICDICAHYMQAIARLMKSSFVYCVDDKDRWQTNVGSCFFLGITNACASNNPALRTSALDLIQSICDASNNDLDYSSYLLFYSAEEEALCVPSVLDLSAYCASKDVKLTVEIFAEAEKVILDLNDYNREIALRVLEPWAYNYGQILQESLSNGKRVVYSPPQQLIRSILNITKKLTEYTHENDIKQLSASVFRFSNDVKNQELMRIQTTSFDLYLERIWYQLIRSREMCEPVAKSVVDLIISELGSSSNTSDITQRMLRNILFWCARDTLSTAAILEQLVARLRSCEMMYPLNKLEFAIWQLNNQMHKDSKEVLVTETCVLKLLSFLAYEHSLDFIPHLPVLLVQAIVDFHSSRYDPGKEATILLENLFQNIVIRQRKSDDDLDSALKFMKSSFRTNAQETRLDIKYSRDAEFLRQYFHFFESSHCPGLAQSTANVALISAIQAKEVKVSIESFHLFYHLNTYFDMSTVETLSLCLFDAIRINNQQKAQIIFDTLEKIPDDVCGRQNVKQLLYRTCLILLHSWNIDHFSGAIQMITRLHHLSGSLSSFVSVSEWPNELGSMDSNISNALSKGLLSYKTMEQTIEMLELFITLDKLPENNMFSSVLVLCYYMLICSGNGTQRLSMLSVMKRNRALAQFTELFKEHIPVFTPNLPTEIDQTSESYRNGLERFSQDFSQVYVKVFGSANGYLIADMLMNWMIYGAEGWSAPSIHLLSKLLPHLYTMETWTVESCAALIHNLKETTAYKEQILSGSAHAALNHILHTMNSECNVRALSREQAMSTVNFLTPIRGFEQNSTQLTRIEKFFSGVTNARLSSSREEMMKLIWVQVLELSLTGENAEVFQRMVDNTAFSLVSRAKSFRSASFISPPDLSTNTRAPDDKLKRTTPTEDDEVKDSPFSPSNTTLQ